MTEQPNYHEYWRSVAPTEPGNRPADYSARSNDIAQWMVSRWPFSPSLKIYELGANVGRNLSYLKKMGYLNISGVEISQQPIDERFPDTDITCGLIEDYKCAHDVLFSVAALMHVEHVPWDEICKARWVSVIEHEDGRDRFQFPRSYRNELEKHGMAIVEDLLVGVDGYVGFRMVLARAGQ